MTKLKLNKDDFDLEELDAAEEGEGFEDYDGPIPPNKTILQMRVVQMWASKSEAGNLRFPYLAIAEGNKGDLEQYNGLPVFDGITWVKTAATWYKPFLAAFGLKLATVLNKTDVEEDEGRFGNKINKIGKWVPDRESKDGLCRMIIKRDRFEGEVRAKCGKFLPLDVADEAEDGEDGEEF